MWMRGPWLQRVVGQRRWLRRLSIGALAQLELRLLSGHKDPAALARIRALRRRRESLLTGNECFLLHALARAQSALDGAMAEVGVYQGVSARLIAEAKGDRPLHLFDTFAGLPDPDAAERRVLTRGQFAASLEGVQRLLDGYPEVHYHPGVFPDSADGAVDGAVFSLVHLDVDLHDSTLAGLRYFYPRLLPGGIIISHDYSILPGVERAFADFLADKPEAVIELPTTQAMVVKR